MLTRALWNTGLAGFPEEYFTDAYVSDYAQRWPFMSEGQGTSQVERYIVWLMRYRTSPNGVFGVKAHSSHLYSTMLRDRDLDSLLHRPKYIWIQRSDRVRQAISYLRAEQTGIWIVDGKHLPLKSPVGTAQYDYDKILRYLRVLDADVEVWETYFKKRELRPYVISYEHLLSEYEAAIVNCLAYLGVPSPNHIPDPGIARQADSITDEWCSRFQRDHFGH